MSSLLVLPCQMYTAKLARYESSAASFGPVPLTRVLVTRSLLAGFAGMVTVGDAPAGPVTCTAALELVDDEAGEDDEQPASTTVTATGARSAAVRRRMRVLCGENSTRPAYRSR